MTERLAINKIHHLNQLIVAGIYSLAISQFKEV
jgi:hypothetical protein